MYSDASRLVRFENTNMFYNFEINDPAFNNVGIAVVNLHRLALERAL
jgi:hypothetical protein